MKKIGLVFASVGIFGIFLAGCGSEPLDDAVFLEGVRESAPASEVVSPPTIELATQMFEMGLIPAEGFTFKEMPIYNRGDLPLVISNITTSCACTTGKMKEDTIPPGGEGTLIIKLDPALVSGGFRSRKRLTITSNDPRSPRTYLIVTAVVEGEISLSAKEIKFGEIEEGESAEQTIKLIQMHKIPFVVEEIHLDGAPEFLKVDIERLPEAEWASADIPEYTFRARVSSENRAGNYNVIARVNFVSGRRRVMMIPIKFTVRGIYGFEPADVTVRNLVPGEIQEGVTILSSKVPLEVTGVKSTNTNMTVTYAPGAEPNTYRFDLLVPERPENRLQKDEWEITMMVDGKEVVEVVRVVALLSRQ